MEKDDKQGREHHKASRVGVRKSEGGKKGGREEGIKNKRTKERKFL